MNLTIFLHRFWKSIEMYPRSLHQANSLLPGMGAASILDHEILIQEYPFKPSVAYPELTLKASQIRALGLEFGPCRIYHNEDIIFISRQHKAALEAFAQRNQIALRPHSWNWDWLLEPYLDTELSPENKENIRQRLLENGFHPEEVARIRAEVGPQMQHYNFDTGLWEWVSLGLFDVLCAMHAAYSDGDFQDFYQRALAKDQRKSR
ncbi:hypothetical protein [Croceiramulus getboli]|nr:hypothetical protein P8624_13995 [Flavobacteriaceae bacterium YJPT1-3]